METHHLNTEQLKKLLDAMGDQSEPPSLTDDPRVNHAVNCLVSYDEEDEPAPTYEEDEYPLIDEIEAAKEQGML
ncbi:hypothetical protein KJ885_05685 [Patescibacteria group bacterium]|nr:hypothetical protein [Patescibacteria group bacterium]